MDWKECNIKRLVKELKPDLELMNSLIETSENKLKVNDFLPLNEITSSDKFTLSYDSLREILEAIAIKKGYKIYNHECFSSFLSEILKESLISREFDNLRKIRNKINYYGKSIAPNQASELIKDTIKLREALINKYLK